MDRIYRVWEIELQAVLEINKVGHRKRILQSVSDHQINPDKIKNEITAVKYFILISNSIRRSTRILSLISQFISGLFPITLYTFTENKFIYSKIVIHFYIRVDFS